MQCTSDDTCPYCEKPIEDIDEYFSNQSNPKFDCPNCGEPIDGREVVTYELCRVEG